MNPTFPKISIVTVSYNQGAFLERTILSVLNQNYPNLEYVIIDGGSTDGSVEIIRKYQDKLAYWVSEKDEGMYHALHKGFEKCTGDYLGWLNSDDMLHPGSFKTIHRIFSTYQEVEWIQGMPSVYDEEDVIIKVTDINCWTKLNFLAAESDFIQQESTFWKRSLWEKTGGYISREYKLAGDYELWARFFQSARLYSVQTILGGFRYRGANQLSVDKLSEYKEEMSKIKKRLISELSAEEKSILDQYMNPSNSFFAKRKNKEISEEVNTGFILTYAAKKKSYNIRKFNSRNIK